MNIYELQSELMHELKKANYKFSVYEFLQQDYDILKFELNKLKKNNKNI